LALFSDDVFRSIGGADDGRWATASIRFISVKSGTKYASGGERDALKFLPRPTNPRSGAFRIDAARRSLNGCRSVRRRKGYLWQEHAELMVEYAHLRRNPGDRAGHRAYLVRLRATKHACACISKTFALTAKRK
jgi:hypothetical protein